MEVISTLITPTCTKEFAPQPYKPNHPSSINPIWHLTRPTTYCNTNSTKTTKIADPPLPCLYCRGAINHRRVPIASIHSPFRLVAINHQHQSSRSFLLLSPADDWPAEIIILYCNLRKFCLNAIQKKILRTCSRPSICSYIDFFINLSLLVQISHVEPNEAKGRRDNTTKGRRRPFDADDRIPTSLDDESRTYWASLSQWWVNVTVLKWIAIVVVLQSGYPQSIQEYSIYFFSHWLPYPSVLTYLTNRTREGQNHGGYQDHLEAVDMLVFE